MGLNKDTRDNKTYVFITDGKFAKRVQKGTEGAKEKKYEYPKGTPKVAYEIYYESINAMIDRIDIKKSDFGEQLLIHLYEADEQFTISLGLTKKEAKGFMRCLPNIDLKKFIFLDPYNYEKDGKKKIGMGIKQENEKILYFYNKENGFPSPPNEDMMDIDEFKILMQQQDLFLKKATLKYIEENFKPAHVAGKIEPNYAVEVIPIDEELGF